MSPWSPNDRERTFSDSGYTTWDSPVFSFPDPCLLFPLSFRRTVSIRLKGTNTLCYVFQQIPNLSVTLWIRILLLLTQNSRSYRKDYWLPLSLYIFKYLSFTRQRFLLTGSHLFPTLHLLSSLNYLQ